MNTQIKLLVWYHDSNPDPDLNFQEVLRLAVTFLECKTFFSKSNTLSSFETSCRILKNIRNTFVLTGRHLKDRLNSVYEIVKISPVPVIFLANGIREKEEIAGVGIKIHTVIRGYSIPHQLREILGSLNGNSS